VGLRAHHAAAAARVLVELPGRGDADQEQQHQRWSGHHGGHRHDLGCDCAGKSAVFRKGQGHPWPLAPLLPTLLTALMKPIARNGRT